MTKRTDTAFVRASQLLRHHPGAITAHTKDCRFVKGGKLVEITFVILRAWDVRPCARCVPWVNDPT